MTVKACAQADEETSASGHDVCAAEEDLPAAGRFFRSLAAQSLRQNWEAVADPQKGLPPFEELALDSPGGLGENVALLEADGSSELAISRTGKVFESWLGRPAHDLKVSFLSIDRARVLREVYAEAIKQGRPVQSVAYGVADGVVCVYDLVAVPLSSRQRSQGARRCMVCILERQRSFGLVETLFQAISDGLAALAVIRDPAGAPCDFLIAALNDGAASIMQGSVESLRGRRLSEVCAALSMSGALERIIGAFNGGRKAQLELECARESGGTLHLSVSLAATGDLVAMTMIDVSCVKAQENSFRLLFESNPVPMWLHCPASLKFLAVNDAAVSHYGYSRDAFLSMSLLDIVPQEARESTESAIRSNPSLKEGIGRLWRHVKADGSPIDVLTSWRDVVFRGEPAQLVAIMDVTEKRQAEKRISYMARHDSLTGLANRTLFQERLDEALVRVRRNREKLAIHCLDLDRFKDVNDTLGHPIGDKLLIAMAERLRSCVREGDIVARFGGDEFAILQLWLAGPHEASALAERIEKVLAEPFEIEGQQIMAG